MKKNIKFRKQIMQKKDMNISLCIYDRDSLVDHENDSRNYTLGLKKKCVIIGLEREREWHI